KLSNLYSELRAPRARVTGPGTRRAVEATERDVLKRNLNPLNFTYLLLGDLQMKLTIKDLSRNEVLGRTEMAGVRGGYLIAPFKTYSYDYDQNFAKVRADQQNNALQTISVAVGNEVAAFDKFKPHVDVHTTLDQDNKVIINQR